MADQTNTPQKDQAEGSRDVIDRELARTGSKQGADEKEGVPGSAGRPQGVDKKSS
jgi:hypothetical protein